MSKTESVWLTPSWEDVEPPYSQKGDLIFPNPKAGEPRELLEIGTGSGFLPLRRLTCFSTTGSNSNARLIGVAPSFRRSSMRRYS